MKVFLQIVSAFWLMHVALAAKGPISNNVCDAVCSETFPVVDNLHLPYTGDCRKFCHCANDGNWEKNCSAPLHFNKDLQVCDWPQNAGCEEGNLPTAAPTQKPTENPNDDSNGVCVSVCSKEFPVTENVHLPYPGDCTKFCHCANNGKWEKNCSAPLHFNKDLQVCDWPQNAGCEEGNPSTIAPTQEPTNDGCEFMTCADDECSESANTLDCQKFCKCSHGSIVVKECAAGLHFNPSTGNCDWPNNAQCEIGSPTTKTPDLSTNCDNICPKVFPIDANRHLPISGVCEQFCHCANNGNWLKDCPPGLHFNKILQVCDWPNSANCTA